MATLSAWYAALPTITRWHLTVLVSTAVMVQVGLVHERNIAFSMQQVMRGQVWRVLTAFAFVDRLGMGFMLYLQTHFFMGLALEGNKKTMQHAYFYLLVIPFIICTIILTSTRTPFLAPSLYTAIMLYYSKLHPDMPVSIMGLIVIPGRQLVWWSFCFQVITGQPMSGMLVGLFCSVVLWYSEVTKHPPAVFQQALEGF